MAAATVSAREHVPAQRTADEALRLVGVDPRAAEQAAVAAVAAARGQRDGVAESCAWRARGRAASETGDHRSAVRFLRRSVTVAEAVGAFDAAAESRISLAGSLLQVGRTAAALAEADRAADTAASADLRARLAAQRATILARVGRLDDALAAYREVIPALRRTGDRVWEARSRNNRALLRGFRGEIAAAVRDLDVAAAMLREEGLAAFAANVQHNIGWLHTRAGDVPSALAALDAAEDAYRALGHPTNGVLHNRAEVLLSAGLADEARTAARAAVEDCRSRRASADCPEAELTLARAELSLGEHAAALTAAVRARREFARQGRDGWRLLAHQLTIDARWQSGERTPRLLLASVHTADRLQSAGFVSRAVDARVIAARLALDLGRTAVADQQLQRASAARSEPVIGVRARAWHAEALLRLGSGRRRAAAAAVRAGLAAVTAHQATLGAAELRASAAGAGRDLAELAIDLALDARGRDAERLLRASERARAQSLWVAPVRPPRDTRVAMVTAQLRAATRDLDDALLAGTPTAGPRRRLVAAEAELQRLTRHVRGASTARAELSMERLDAALGDRALVEYVEHRGDLLAVVSFDGRRRWQRLGARAPIAREAEQLRAALRRASRGGTSALPRRVMAATAAQLDSLVLAPLAVPPSASGLVVAATGALHGVPWSLLPTVASRCVVVAPSAALWLHAEQLLAAVQPGRTVLVAGPGLPQAAGEVGAITASWPGAVVLAGRSATVQATLRALDGAATTHIAAHATFRSDSPLFSALRLADGPLTVHDLERLHRPPSVVVLSACQSGLSVVHPGEELLGFTAALLGGGTAALIASVVPVSDEATAPAMTALHQLLAGGMTPGAALAAVQAAAASDVERAAAASFVCFGAG